MWLPSPARAADPTPVPTASAPITTADKKDPDAYNYLPITFGAGSGAGDGSLRDTIIEGLVFQNGYEVQCAAPQWKIKPELFGEWKRYFELYDDPSFEFFHEPLVGKSADAGDKYEVKMADARLPMLRGEDDYNKINKISSLEAFFGTVNPALPADQPNSSGVVQSLLSLSQQCSLKMGNLQAIKDVCGKLEDPSKCYLNRVIPGVNPELKMLNLLDVLDAARTNYLANLPAENQGRVIRGQTPLSTNFCDEFVQTSQTEPLTKLLFGLSSADHKKYTDVLLKTPLDVDTLYRIAFLVIAPTHNLEGGEEDFFWFRQQDSPDIKLEDPIIVAFRVPDFTMNKPLKLSSLQDSGQITNDLLKTETQNKFDYEAARSRRDAFLKRSLAAKDTNQTDETAHIYCPGLPQCPPGGGGSEQGILRQAIMDIVNGLGPKPSCDGIGGYIENAGEISTSTTFDDNNRKFAPGLIQTLLPQTDSQKFAWELVIDKKNADESKLKDPNNTVEVNAWVVSPSGIDLKQFEGALQSFFSAQTFKMMVAGNCLPDANGVCGIYPERYPFKSTDQQNPIAKLYANAGQVSFIDPDEPVICRDEKFPDPLDPTKKITKEVCRPNEKNAGITLVENRDELGIASAKLGWLVRKISETIRPLDIQIKCSRTEDLFLGKCKVVPRDQAGSGPDVDSATIPCALELPYNPALNKYLTANKQGYLDEMQKAFPYTLMTKAQGDSLYDFVMDYSKQNGWNPAIILALGREETAWGGVGDRPHALGCMNDIPSPLPDPNDSPEKKIIRQQMDCVFNNFSTDMSCVRFECKYGPGYDSESCIFGQSVNKFPARIDFYYRNILAPFKPVDTNLQPSPILPR